MSEAVTLSSVLWVLNITLGAGIGVRLFALDLHRRYPWFFAYWILSAARSIALLVANGDRWAYATLWLYTQPLIWLANVMIVLEIFSLTLGGHRGIYSLARWFLLAAIGLASFLAFASLLPTWGDPKHDYEVALIAERGIRTSLALFLLLMVVFLQWYPVPVSRNLGLHCFIFTAFFLSSSAAILYRNMGGWIASPLASQINMALGLAAQVAWLVLLSRQGEELPARARIQRGAEEERRLLEQLDAINSTLLRAGRK